MTVSQWKLVNSLVKGQSIRCTVLDYYPFIPFSFLVVPWWTNMIMNKTYLVVQSGLQKITCKQLKRKGSQKPDKICSALPCSTGGKCVHYFCKQQICVDFSRWSLLTFLSFGLISSTNKIWANLKWGSGELSKFSKSRCCVQMFTTSSLVNFREHLYITKQNQGAVAHWCAEGVLGSVIYQ